MLNPATKNHEHWKTDNQEFSSCHLFNSFHNYLLEGHWNHLLETELMATCFKTGWECAQKCWTDLKANDNVLYQTIIQGFFETQVQETHTNHIKLSIDLFRKELSHLNPRLQKQLNNKLNNLYSKLIVCYHQGRNRFLAQIDEKERNYENN